MTRRGTIVAPLSRKAIRRQARLVRGKIWDVLQRYGIEKSLYIPLDKIFEIASNDKQAFGFVPEVVCDNDIEGDLARADTKEGIIQVSESTYEGLCNGNPRARFTLLHEMGHLFLYHQPELTFSRSSEDIPAFKDSEWQADNFAAELAMPLECFEIYTDGQIAEMCGISLSAVRCRRNILKKESLTTKYGNTQAKLL